MIKIDRWLDIESEEFKKLDDASSIRQFMLRGLKCEAIKPDNNGNLYTNDNLRNPLHDKIDGELIGYKWSAKASN